MNIRKINLNLLITLDALLTELNVSRAAEKVFITQPAMSNSLTQLRNLFNDKLLIRSGNKMKPTTLALELAPKIKNILEEIEETVLNREIFDPEKAKRLFKIGMSDYGEFLLLPLISEQLAIHAPNISLKIIHMNNMDDPSLFIDGIIDIGIGINHVKATAINTDKLFIDKAVCVARANHPIMKKLTLKKYLSAKHIAIVFQNDMVGTITDSSLKGFNASREIVLAVPHMLAALHAIPKTPYIATIPERIAVAFQKIFKLSMQKPPFEIPDVTISQAWHKRFDNDQGHQWFRQIIKNII